VYRKLKTVDLRQGIQYFTQQAGVGDLINVLKDEE
jgi:hypothetical protein